MMEIKYLFQTKASSVPDFQTQGVLLSVSQNLIFCKLNIWKYFQGCHICQNQKQPVILQRRETYVDYKSIKKSNLEYSFWISGKESGRKRDKTDVLGG